VLYGSPLPRSCRQEPEVKELTGRILALLTLFCFLCGNAQAEDRKLLTLAALSYASAVYDTQTTLRTLDNCGTCSEGNFMMRPFVGNRTAAYAFSMGLTTAATYSTFKLRQDGVRWWWIPMAATIALHVTAGAHNQRIR
jgi:hypothetical protein